MNRAEFIEKKWRGYLPLRDEDLENPSGRVLGIENEFIEMSRAQKKISIAKSSLSLGEDPYWGPSFDVSQIEVGDILLLKDSKIFMLAPHIGRAPWIANPRPRAWSQFINQVRRYFSENQFQEILTPYLVPSPGVDHHIDFMQVKACHTERVWSLPTSPEIHLKKALCQGYENIFEIKSCFRDDLPGPHHSAEFSMLEWYRAYSNLSEIKKDLQGLLQFLTDESIELEEISLATAFTKYCDFSLTPDTSIEELKSWVLENQIEFHPDDDWNDLFFRIYMEKIEPFLGMDQPCLITNFPAQQASLAHVTPSGWAARFELYWKGMELANAYLEVNDPGENRRRFQEERDKRKSKGVLLAEDDSEFFELLEQGMPPAGGIALGLDRLFKILQALS